VIAAVEQGLIDEDSYKNFLKIQKESTLYETSYLDKRRKSKAFSRAQKRHMKASKKK
jgi:ribosome biogenesis GTPase